MYKSLSNVAIKNKERSEILKLIGMQPKADLIEGWVAVDRDETIIGKLNGYFLIVDGTWSIVDENDDTILSNLSQNAELIYGLIEE